MFQNTTVCWVTSNNVIWDPDLTMCMTTTTGCLLGTSWINDVTSLLTTRTNNTDLMDITFVSGSENKITSVVTMQPQFCKLSPPLPICFTAFFRFCRVCQFCNMLLCLYDLWLLSHRCKWENYVRINRAFPCCSYQLDNVCYTEWVLLISCILWLPFVLLVSYNIKWQVT